MKSLLKSPLRGSLTQLRRLIARYWVVPLEALLYEMVGFDQSSPWHRLRTAIVWIKDLGRLIYTGFRVNVSRWDGPEWSVIYVSDDSTDSEKELQYLLFARAPTETKLDRTFMWKLPRLIQRSVSQGCLVVCDVNRLIKWQLPGLYCIRVFPWLRAFLDVSAPMDLALKRMRTLRKRDLSKTQKLGVEYGSGHELADLELFYHKMYVPFIKERYGERALLYSYEGQREVLEKKGELLWVKYQGNPVVAYLGTLRRGKTFSALHLGVHQDHMHLVRQGVITALYWHVITWAHANHLHVVDFGRTRARLDDGVFEFKRQFGMRFERDITIHTMWTFIGKDLPLFLIRLLNEMALIAEVGKEYRCVVFDSDGTGLSDKELARREKVITQAGLDGLLIV